MTAEADHLAAVALHSYKAPDLFRREQAFRLVALYDGRRMRHDERSAAMQTRCNGKCTRHAISPSCVKHAGQVKRETSSVFGAAIART
jgi:hypothetical protein